jgi:hypothetical protein
MDQQKLKAFMEKLLAVDVKSLNEQQLKEHMTMVSHAKSLAEELKGLQGVSEDQEPSPVASAITRRIMLQRTDLLSKYGPEQVGNAIDEVADFVGDVDEIGSSDVSGWVKHVERLLGNMNESVHAEAFNRLKKVFKDFKG